MTTPQTNQWKLVYQIKQANVPGFTQRSTDHSSEEAARTALSTTSTLLSMSGSSVVHAYIDPPPGHGERIKLR